MGKSSKHLGIGVICLMAVLASAIPGRLWAKGKPKPEPAAPVAAHGALPADLNVASLRVSAMDMVYEMDLSIEQLRALRADAAGAASAQPRKPAKADAKLAAALQELASQLLDSKDDQAIAKARSDVIEQSSGWEPPLDDEIITTPAARSRAPASFARLKASQIAAFLATHADEVGDPAEMMIDALVSLRASHEKDAGGGNAESMEEIAVLIEDVSTKVSVLVAGSEDARYKEVARQVTAWLNSNLELNDQAYAARQTTLEASARKIVGDVSNMTLLQHWLENQVAILLSNPELPAAIDAIEASRR